MDETRRLEKLGEKVAAEIGSGPDPRRLEAQRRAVLALAAARPAGRRLRFALAAGATLLVAVCTFVLLEVLVSKPLVFWVGDQTRGGEEGAWLQATGNEAIPIRFEDGTRMELQQGSAGRVFAADRRQVRVVLGQGRIEASIGKKTRSRWMVEAGPYQVAAQGTAFVVSWNTEPLLLEVSVHSGRVVVKGPGLQAGGVRLSPRDHLRLAKTGQHFSLSVENIPAPPPEPPAEPPSPVEADEREAAIEAVKLKSVSLPPRAAPKPPGEPAVSGSKVAALDRHAPETWQDLCDLGRYQDALREAEKQGLEVLLQTSDDSQLWRLGEAARFSGRGQLAREALLSIRRRFRSSWRSKVSAFLLGRIAAEMLSDHREACAWFKIYLMEDPEGPLVEESLGRRIGACREAGLKAEACRVAAKYLNSYPTGSFAEFARSVLRYQGPSKRGGGPR